MEIMISGDVLGNFGVMSATVLAVVEAIKRAIYLIRPKAIPDRTSVIIALVISFAVAFGYTAYLDNWTVLSVFLAIANGFGIFGASTAGYKVLKPKLKKLKEVI